MTKLLMSSNTDWYLYNFRLSLAKYLQDEGIDVVLVSPRGEYVNLLENAGFRWLEWKIGRQTLAPRTEFGSILNLKRIYDREKPELVHHHTIKPVLYGSLAARWSKVPGCVNSITGRGYVFLGNDRKARILKMFIEPFYRLAFNNPRCSAIFENETDQQYFLDQSLITPERTWLIQGVGVDVERYKKLPEPDGIPVILMAARMLWDKGVGVLVEAARLLKDKVPVRIVLVGNPDVGNPSSIELKTLQGWNEEGVVEWWGWRADMSDIYNQSHIVTLPTRYGEGVPTTLLEAAACGRPLVASDIAGCRHVVKEGYNGFLVPVNDPNALAQALEKLACTPELRQKMGRASRQLVLENFPQSRVNAETLEVYKHTLKVN